MDTDEKFKRMVEQKKKAVARSIERRKNRLLASPQYIKNKILNLLRLSNRSGTMTNVLRVGLNNTKEHEMTKFEVFWWLRQQGYDVVTEAIFADYSARADILCLDLETIFEITKSETEKELAEKIKKYPPQLHVVRVDANKPFDERDLL